MMHVALYRLTIGLSLVSALLSAAYLSYVLPTIGGVFVLAVSQIAIYAVIVGFAWICRSDVAGSRVVLAMAALAMLLNAALLYTVTPPLGYGAAVFILLNLLGQTVIAVLGCYLGYALVESRKRHQHHPRSATGKLVAVGLLAAGFLAIAYIAAS